MRKVTIIVILFLIAAVFAARFGYKAAEGVNTVIIKQTTDERGLISVIYTKGIDTLALDYITAAQLDSLIIN